MRCFVAVDFSDEIRRNIMMIIDKLSPHSINVKWVNDDTIHLTLKFFADLEENLRDGVINCCSHICKQFSPFKLMIDGLGYFGGGGRMRVIWCGIKGDLEEIGLLQKQIEDGCFCFGIEREKRPFKPHLTLGRLRTPGYEKPLRSAIDREINFSGGEVLVDHLSFYKSTLTTKGPIYERIAQWRFKTL